MTRPGLALTGVTGVLGRLVAEDLAAAGVPFRVLARRPERVPAIPGAVVVPASYSDAGGGLDGVRVLLMVSASESADRLDEHRAFVDAAAAAGVEHVVYTSFFGAAPTATFTLARDHDATERYLVASGMGHTFLRDNLYLDFLIGLVGEDGVIRGPAGDGRLSAVSRADIARTASVVLQDVAAHAGRTYDLTGREALTMDGIAAVLSAHLGRDVSYLAETIPEAYESRRRWAAPDWQLDAWVSTYTAIANGEMAAISPDVEAITGLPPQTLAEVLAAEG